MSEPETDAVAQQPAVGFYVLHHYLKDLSFENPRGPIREALKSLPRLALEGRVQATPEPTAAGDGAPRDVVELTVTVTAEHEQRVVFLAEITYVGEVRLENVPDLVRPQILHVNVPQFLLPQVNQVIDHAARAAGYSGLVVPGIDFLGAFHRSGGAALKPTPPGDAP